MLVKRISKTNGKPMSRFLNKNNIKN